MIKKYITLSLSALFLSGCVTSNTVNVKSLVNSKGGVPLVDVIKTDEVQQARINVERKKPLRVKQKSTRASRKLNRITKRLIKAGPLPKLNVPIHLTSCGVAAKDAALSDGSIRICKETLKELKNEDEIAFLIGHELSHHILNHAPEEDVYFTEQQKNDDKAEETTGYATALGTLAALAIGADVTRTVNGVTKTRKGDKEASEKLLVKTGAAALATKVFFENVQPIISKGYGAKLNRGEEDEADILAIDLLSKAGWNPSAAADVFSLIENSRHLENDANDTGDTKDSVEMTLVESLNNGGNVLGMLEGALANTAESFVNYSNHSKTEKRRELSSAYIKKFYVKETRRKKKRF